MKKLFIFLVVLFFYSAASFPQINITASLGSNNIFKEFANYYKTGSGLGVSGGIEYHLPSSDIAASTELSYIKFTGLRSPSMGGPVPDIDILTFTGGIKWFGKYPYFGARMGLISSKIQDTGTSYESSFMWALQAGLRFPITQRGPAFDFNIQYNRSSNNGKRISFIGYNFGIAFAL